MAKVFDAALSKGCEPNKSAEQYCINVLYTLDNRLNIMVKNVNNTKPNYIRILLLTFLAKNNTELNKVTTANTNIQNFSAKTGCTENKQNRNLNYPEI